MLSAYIRPRRRYHWRRLPVNGIMRSSVSSAASLHLRRYTTPLQCSLTRHFHRYRICLQAATSVYITRQNFIPSNLVFSRDFRTTAIESLGKNGNKSSRNHQGIDNYCWTRACVCVYIYTSDETSIIWSSGIPRSAHLFRILGTGILESTLRHWRTNDDTKPGATAQTIYFMSFPLPLSFLPPLPPRGRPPPF